MVRVAIIGMGFIGKVHAESYKKINNAKIVAIVSRSAMKGKKIAEKLDAKNYTSLEALLDNEEVDIVDICTPTYTHADAVIKAARAGKNILCEKPLALTLKDANTMIEVVEQNNVKAMVGHTLRFFPEYMKAKEIVDRGDLGEPFHCFCARLAVTPDWHSDGWGMEEKFSGGSVLDLHIHDLDFLISLFGKPKNLFARGIDNPRQGGLAHISTNIEFYSGQLGFAEAGWDFKGSFPFTMVFRILCKKGTIEWTFRSGKNLEERKRKPSMYIYRNDGSVEKPVTDQTDAYILECKYLIESVINNTPVEKATFLDGKKALELALASMESARKSKKIKLN